MAERAGLAKRDWFSVRDELWRIEDFLDKWSQGTEGQLSKDPVAVILAKEIDSYRSHVAPKDVVVIHDDQCTALLTQLHCLKVLTFMINHVLTWQLLAGGVCHI